MRFDSRFFRIVGCGYLLASLFIPVSHNEILLNFFITVLKLSVSLPILLIDEVLTSSPSAMDIITSSIFWVYAVSQILIILLQVASLVVPHRLAGRRWVKSAFIIYYSSVTIMVFSTIIINIAIALHLLGIALTQVGLRMYSRLPVEAKVA